MAFINQDTGKLIQQLITTRKLAAHQTASILGFLIGRHLSLLGTTQDERSLVAVDLALREFVSEVNELVIINVDATIGLAKEQIEHRYNEFFFPSRAYGYHYKSSEVIADISEKLSREETRELFGKLEGYILSTGIGNIIHNQKKPETSEAPAKED